MAEEQTTGERLEPDPADDDASGGRLDTIMPAQALGLVLHILGGSVLTDR